MSTAKSLPQTPLHQAPADANSGTSTTLAEALVEAQKNAGMVGKHGQNKHFGYSYASSEDIIAASDVLADAGLSFSPHMSHLTTFRWDQAWTDDKGVQHEGHEAVLMLESRFLLEHVNGESRIVPPLELPPWETPVIPEKGRPLDKAMGAARTYALGYCLRDLLLLPRVEAGNEVDQRDDRDRGPPARHPGPQAAQQPKRDAGPAARAPVAQDWGDKAQGIARHVTDARTIGALEVASAELQAAVGAGMPAPLAAPIRETIAKAFQRAAEAKAKRDRERERPDTEPGRKDLEPADAREPGEEG